MAADPVARATLANERVNHRRHPERQRVAAEDLPALQSGYAPGGTALTREIVTVIAEGWAMELLNLRVVERAVLGAAPSVEGAIGKLLSAEHAQRVTERGMRHRRYRGRDRW